MHGMLRALFEVSSKIRTQLLISDPSSFNAQESLDGLETAPNQNQRHLAICELASRKHGHRI